MVFMCLTSIVNLGVELVDLAQSFDFYPNTIRKIDGKIQVISVFVGEGRKGHKPRSGFLRSPAKLINGADDGRPGLSIHKNAQEHTPFGNGVASRNAPR